MRFVTAAFVLLVASIGCNSSGGGGGTAAPTKLVNEVFDGILAVRGSNVHTFTLKAAGDLSITLRLTGPPAGIVLGLGIGQPSSTDSRGCVLSTSPGATISTPAGPAPQIFGSGPAATYCALVYDIGQVTAPLSYTLVIAHP